MHAARQGAHATGGQGVHAARQSMPGLQARNRCATRTADPDSCPGQLSWTADTPRRTTFLARGGPDAVTSRCQGSATTASHPSPGPAGRAPGASIPDAIASQVRASLRQRRTLHLDLQVGATVQHEHAARHAAQVARAERAHQRARALLTARRGARTRRGRGAAGPVAARPWLRACRRAGRQRQGLQSGPCATQAPRADARRRHQFRSVARRSAGLPPLRQAAITARPAPPGPGPGPSRTRASFGPQAAHDVAARGRKGTMPRRARASGTASARRTGHCAPAPPQAACRPASMPGPRSARAWQRPRVAAQHAGAGRVPQQAGGRGEEALRLLLRPPAAAQAAMRLG